MKLKKSELRELIREEARIIFEKLEYDEDKLMKLIDKDKMLKHQYKTKKGKKDPEKFFNTFVLGDDDLEKEYMKL